MRIHIVGVEASLLLFSMQLITERVFLQVLSCRNKDIHDSTTVADTQHILTIQSCEGSFSFAPAVPNVQSFLLSIFFRVIMSKKIWFHKFLNLQSYIVHYCCDFDMLYLIQWPIENNFSVEIYGICCCYRFIMLQISLLKTGSNQISDFWILYA